MDSKRVMKSLVMILLFGAAMPSSAHLESADAPAIDNLSVSKVSLVQVRFRVDASEQALAIPYCMTDEAGSEQTCSLATSLQVKTPQGWRSAGLRSNSGVLGGVPLSSAKIRLLQPHTGAYFRFTFAQHLFKIDRGQQLRVIVDAWPNEQAVVTSAPSVRLQSPVFQLP